MLETTNNEEYKWFEKRIVSIFKLPYTVDPKYCKMRKLLEKKKTKIINTSSFVH